MTDRDLKPENMHCRHPRCCPCGAARGTPEHAEECPDAVVMRALAKRSVEHTSRKLSRKQ